MKPPLILILAFIVSIASAAEPVRTYDLVVFGGTAPGIVAAVRAAREGLNVALVSRSKHLGGSLPSLGAVETHYAGNRAPLLDEFVAKVKAHYRAKDGEDSDNYRACAGGRMITYEPQVAEAILERMLAAESRIKVYREFTPTKVEKEGKLITAVQFVAMNKSETLRLAARSFMEAGYEGDLMAAAGVKYRVGRESRSEYNEPRAGRVFTHWLTGQHPLAAVEGRLNLVISGATTSDPLPGSTGEGDDNIQSYSYRLCITDDPANRRLLDSPPVGYDRARFAPILLSVEEKARLSLPFHHRFQIYPLQEMVERDHIFHGHALPNRKRSWNATNLTGGGKAYPEADEATRRLIEKQHRDHALGLMWFLQNDPGMPDALRSKAREWGLAKDEFADTDNIPSQLYVREARRLVGRAVFTENDALLSPGLGRAPVHTDSIGITEFSLDSLACTTERLGDSLCDGQLFQMEVSRPGQVPWNSLLPQEYENLVVVTTLSATHVGWGAIRLPPTWMHLAESAAWAIVLANQADIAPAQVSVDQLQQRLAISHVMISFFNDVDVASDDPRVPAAQYFGTKGFFSDYDGRLDDMLTEGEKAAWDGGFEQLKKGILKSIQLAKAVHVAAAKQTPKTKQTRGAALLEMWNALNPQ
ncbi:FAD-dependent oxidoreductase [Prosthecobacter fusiformis]|nr:FAD-dependent oxidoreductase [Prosthecobacter fusiformis]